MPSQLDSVADVPPAQADSSAASSAMMAEVSADRSAAKPVDNSGNDQKSDNTADKMFGPLSIVGDQTKTGSAAVCEQPAPVCSASDAPPASPAAAGDQAPVCAAGDAPASAAASEQAAVASASGASAAGAGAAVEGLSSPTKDINASLPTTDKISFGAPDEDDKQAFRDLSAKTREAVDQSVEPEKKAKMDQLADTIKDDKAREQFKKDIDTVENRNPPVSVAERARLYNQVQKLMEAGDNPAVPLNADDRSKLAQEIMHKSADPTTVDQGLKGTCNVATVESRTFTREPSAAAKVIVDVATTGEYTAPDGTKVKPDKGSIKPDIEVQNPSGVFKNPRDHADQIFQVTAVNAAWQTHDLVTANGRVYPKGTVEYRETDPATGQEAGEHLYDKSKNPPELITENGKPIDHPHLNGNQITDVANLISGQDDKNFVLEHGGSGAAEKTFKVNSEAELKDKLKSMKEHGELPAIVMVDTDNPPFWGENIKLSPGFIPARTVGGHHVVTITDYDEKTGLVSMDNQWGKGRDHIGGSGISTGDLYLATMPRDSQESINILDRDVKWNRDHDTVNASKEIELLQKKNFAGQLSDADFKKQLDQTMEDAHKRWAAKGTKEDDVERLQAEEYYAKINKSKEVIPIIHMQTE